VLPASCDAHLEQGSWTVPRIFDEIAVHGAVEPAEMARVFNLGLGMVLAVAAGAADDVRAALATAGQESSVVGDVVAGSGKVVLA
jgi:phosphoribosylformylglycinamidine cyclo-ligase